MLFPALDYAMAIIFRIWKSAFKKFVFSFSNILKVTYADPFQHKPSKIGDIEISDSPIV